MELDEHAKARLSEIASELSSVGMSIPGSLVIRRFACGKAGCGCHNDESKLHGPYISWTRKINNKTVTRLLNQVAIPVNSYTQSGVFVHFDRRPFHGRRVP